ncbi:MAG: DHA2 family efflux MFS transporter permease subunit [Solirubrobacterales bacterium]|nr:DHA2 family efflux MFS transporter permease subunit [Solirubrobacterales bacterium]
MNRSTYLAMGAMALGVFVIANDITAMNVALPAIEKDFDTSVTTVQWVVNAYALVFGVLIVTGGRLADLFGRREAFFVGAVIFLVASLAAATAQSEAWLIAARAVMGIGGALIWPAVLGMTFALLPAEKAGLAGGLILGVAGVGNALGPLIGGALTEFASWRWILFLNVPIALIAILAVYFLIHQPRPDAEDRKIDYAGIATVSLGLVLFMVALDQVVDLGWGDPRVIISVIISVVLLSAFGFIERRAGSHALVPRDVMRNTSFTAACIAILFISATFFSVLFYIPQYLQKAGGLSPFESGLGLLPFMAVFALTSFTAGPLYNRVGGRIIVTLGAAFIALGPLLISFGVKESGSLGGVVPGLVVLGIGVGLFYSSATTIGVTAVDESRSSLAGGIIYMFQVAGGSVGLALTTTLFASASGLISGLHIAFRFNAIAALVGFLIILIVVGPRVKPVVATETKAGTSG